MLSKWDDMHSKCIGWSRHSMDLVLNSMWTDEIARSCLAAITMSWVYLTDEMALKAAIDLAWARASCSWTTKKRPSSTTFDETRETETETCRAAKVGAEASDGWSIVFGCHWWFTSRSRLAATATWQAHCAPMSNKKCCCCDHLDSCREQNDICNDAVYESRFAVDNCCWIAWIFESRNKNICHQLYLLIVALSICIVL